MLTYAIRALALDIGGGPDGQMRTNRALQAKELHFAIRDLVADIGEAPQKSTRASWVLQGEVAFCN
jgi:hypothetical protein